MPETNIAALSPRISDKTTTVHIKSVNLNS